MTSKRSYSISDRRVIGLLCGIVAGVSYGTNPLFAKPLLESGVPVLVMLFFRYALSATLLGIWMVLNGEKLSTSRRELGLLVVLGLLFAGSSIFLSEGIVYLPALALLIQNGQGIQNGHILVLWYLYLIYCRLRFSKIHIFHIPNILWFLVQR